MILRYPEPLLQARLLRRYKRFLADIAFPDGTEGIAHCGNPGSMMGLAEPDSTVWLSANRNPAAKLAWRWEIASQTIPILAIAPMVVVVMNSIGFAGLVPKSIISMYLSFFPVVVGMTSGLRSPDRILMDQMRTWNASALQTLWTLRLPSAVPYLFASLKVAIAASLVGAIVGELPINQDGGLGARMLVGSYYGQTIQIWSALLSAAALAACLVGIVGLTQRLTLRRMGLAR